jgi:VanZ family protein
MLIFLFCAPTVSAYYPFDVTLDVSTVWGNLKRIEFIPFTRGLHRSWTDLLMEKVLVFAAITYVIGENLPRTTQAKGIAQAWLIAVSAGVMIESGKLFFVGRVPNSDNVVWILVGATVGAILAAYFGRIGVTQSVQNRILLLLAICVLGYFELKPFDWLSPQELLAKLSRIEWLPFAAYYSADPRAALFDLITKLYLSAPLGFLLMAQWQIVEQEPKKLIAVWACLMLALCLEAAQLAVRSRLPSVTDVAIIGLGSWLGAVVFERYQLLRRFSRKERTAEN